MTRIAFLVALAASFFSACSSSSKAQPSPVARNRALVDALEGSWSGVILTYPAATHVELTVEGQQGSGEGEIQFDASLRSQPLEVYLDGGRFDRAGTSDPAAVTLTLDAGLRTFRVANARGLRRTGRRSASRQVLQQLTGKMGLFARGAERLVLLPPNSRSGLGEAISFVRPADFKRTAKKFKSVMRRRNVKSHFSSAPSKSKLRKWAGPLLEAHGDAYLSQMGGGAVERAAIALFEDEYFEEFFGKPFDQLSVGSMAKTKKCLQKFSSRRASDADKSMYALHRAFWPHLGSPSATQTLQGVYALRGIQAWLDGHQTAFLASAGAEGDWENVEAVLAAAQSTATTWVLPDRMTKLEEVAEGAFAKMAYPSLTSELDRLEGKADSAAGRAALATFNRTHRKRLKRLGSKQQRELKGRASAAHEAAIDQVVAELGAELDSLGPGLEGLLAGNRWWARSQAQLATGTKLRSVRDLMARFEELRRGAREAAEPQMLARISRAEAKELDDVSSSWFGAPGDTGSSTQAAVNRAISKRRQELSAAHEGRIQDAVARAKQEVARRPGQALRYIDFRKFPNGDFLGFIYHGIGNNKTQADLLRLLGTTDVEEMVKIAGYASKMKLAFATYHDLYYRRYGSTARARRSSGESWYGIHHVTIHKDRWGGVTDRYEDPEPFVYVRARFANAYKRTLANGVDALVAIFGAAADAVRQPGRQEDVHGRFTRNLFGNILTAHRDYERAYEPFLDSFKDSYPATVAHFEENLRRAFQLESLRVLQPLPLGR